MISGSVTLSTFKCPLCTEFEATEFRLLLPHIRLVHSTRPGFSIQCSIENCSRVFTNMKTYTNHIYGDHECLPRTARDYSLDSSPDMDASSENEVHEYSHTQGFPPAFESIIACWILKLKEGCKLTQSTTEEIIQRVTDLNQYILSQVFLAVKEAIRKSGQDSSIINLE